MSVMDAAKGITKGQVLRYMFMPQIVPRLNAFYQTGFGTLAYIIAMVYRAINILPANHPIFEKSRRDSLGMREVLAAAASELKFDRNHIDQVILYFTILFGLFLLAGQFILTLGYLMVSPALAGATDMPTNYAGFFATPDQKQDIVYRMMFTVFGVPELFREGAQLSDFHVALHALFQFYSIGILVIAVIVVSYFIFAILAETAQTGVPFGKRYDHVWAPIRLVVGLGLLIPVGYGLNSAQWITLYSAKFGSDFATRGWNLFNDKMKQEYISGTEKPVGVPKPPDLTQLASFMMMVGACEYAYENVYQGVNRREIKGYLVKNNAEGNGGIDIETVTYKEAKEYFNNGDILIRFGEKGEKAGKHDKFTGYVYPYCGELVLSSAAGQDPGSEFMQTYYFELVQLIYLDKKFSLADYGIKILRGQVKINGEGFLDQFKWKDWPPADYKTYVARSLLGNGNDGELLDAIKTATKTQIESDEWKKDEETRKKLGWGAAGIWYNKIAQMNGSLVTSVNSVPEPRVMPYVMEKIRNEQTQNSIHVTDPYETYLAGTSGIAFDTPIDKDIATGLVVIHQYWKSEDPSDKASTNNFIIDVINLIFGTQGLFNMCANADVHPLAQLSLLGKGLIESTIRNIGLSLGVGVIGGMFLNPTIQSIASVASGVLLSIATITLTLGFVLFYVIPFMPFLYFFFAVGGWIRGVFEAMVGMPLWALAHIRIDGEGLPGEAASSGYFLIFEIFLRPLLIIFGLLASIIIFSSMVKVLNEIFALVVTNLAGHDRSFAELCGKAVTPTPGIENNAMSYFRGPVDQLFFTVVYAIIVYMIGMSCFKLIDLVPNNILRYMGANARTFNDSANDPTDGLVMKLSAGSGMIGGKVVGIMGDAGKLATTGASALLTPKPPQ